MNEQQKLHLKFIIFIFKVPNKKIRIRINELFIDKWFVNNV